MSGIPKDFRISKVRLVNVFRKSFFLNATWYAMQHGVGEQNGMT